jgi:hypothetical protein
MSMVGTSGGGAAILYIVYSILLLFNRKAVEGNCSSRFLFLWLVQLGGGGGSCTSFIQFFVYSVDRLPREIVPLDFFGLWLVQFFFFSIDRLKRETVSLEFCISMAVTWGGGTLYNLRKFRLLRLKGSPQKVTLIFSLTNN